MPNYETILPTLPNGRDPNISLDPSFYYSNDWNGNDKALNEILKERDQKINLKDLHYVKSFSMTPEKDNALPSTFGSYRKFILRNVEKSLLSDTFFSQTNIENIQNLIKFLVYKQMKRKIDNQSIIELLVVMSSIYIQYNHHPEIIDEFTPTEKKNKLLIKYTEEIDRLNRIAVNDIVPRICSSLQQYIDYLHDASQPLRPMNNPENTSVSGKRTYRSTTNVLGGGI